MSLTFSERVNKTMLFALKKPASVLGTLAGGEINVFTISISGLSGEITAKVERKQGSWFVSYVADGIPLDSGHVREPSPEYDLIMRIVGLAQSKSLSSSNSAAAEGRNRLDNILNS